MSQTALLEHGFDRRLLFPKFGSPITPIQAVMMQQCGGKEAFEEALANGDITMQKDANGKEKYYQDQIRKVRKVGWKDTSTTHMGTKKIDGKKAVLLSKI